MNEANRVFRERLLDAEQVTPALKERYHKELQAMLEKQLSGMQRWGWLGSAIMGLGFAALFGTLAVVAPAEFPWWGRLIFATGACLESAGSCWDSRSSGAVRSIASSIPGLPAAWGGGLRFWW